MGHSEQVTILILIDGFLQYGCRKGESRNIPVTILILIDGFLQCVGGKNEQREYHRHNPYFNRWFSAI